MLVRRAQDHDHRLSLRWYGPCRITALHSSLVYEITSLRSEKAERIHCARPIKYRDSLLGQPVPKEMMDLAERTRSRSEVVDKILHVGEAPNGFCFRVQ